MLAVSGLLQRTWWDESLTLAFPVGAVRNQAKGAGDFTDRPLHLKRSRKSVRAQRYSAVNTARAAAGAKRLSVKQLNALSAAELDKAIRESRARVPDQRGLFDR